MTTGRINQVSTVLARGPRRSGGPRAQPPEGQKAVTAGRGDERPATGCPRGAPRGPSWPSNCPHWALQGTVRRRRLPGRPVRRRQTAT